MITFLWDTHKSKHNDCENIFLCKNIFHILCFQHFVKVIKRTAFSKLHYSFVNILFMHFNDHLLATPTCPSLHYYDKESFLIGEQKMGTPPLTTRSSSSSSEWMRSSVKITQLVMYHHSFHGLDLCFFPRVAFTLM